MEILVAWMVVVERKVKEDIKDRLYLTLIEQLESDRNAKFDKWGLC